MSNNLDKDIVREVFQKNGFDTEKDYIYTTADELIEAYVRSRERWRDFGLSLLDERPEGERLVYLARIGITDRDRLVVSKQLITKDGEWVFVFECVVTGVIFDIPQKEAHSYYQWRYTS